TTRVGSVRGQITASLKFATTEYDGGQMSIRVLVTDDEPIARRRIRRFLRAESNVEVIGEASNGREAIEAIRQHNPDLVFLDVQMPDVDGFGVVQALGPDQMPAVIFVTAYDEYALKAFEVNAL